MQSPHTPNHKCTGLQEKYGNLVQWHKMMLDEEEKLKKTTDSNSDTVVFKEIVDACKKDAEVTLVFLCYFQ